MVGTGHCLLREWDTGGISALSLLMASCRDGGGTQERVTLPTTECHRALGSAWEEDVQGRLGGKPPSLPCKCKKKRRNQARWGPKNTAGVCMGPMHQCWGCTKGLQGAGMGAGDIPRVCTGLSSTVCCSPKLSTVGGCKAQSCCKARSRQQSQKGLTLRMEKSRRALQNLGYLRIRSWGSSERMGDAAAGKRLLTSLALGSTGRPGPDSAAPRQSYLGGLPRTRGVHFGQHTGAARRQRDAEQGNLALLLTRPA